MSHPENQKPLLARYLIWSKTRYPFKNWIFSTLVYIAIAIYVRSLAWQDHLVLGSDALMALAVGCFFLLLRIYDEHKDYEIDREFHPDRPVARGVVSLTELKYLFAGAWLVQVAITIAFYGYDSPAFMAWAIAFVWSLLMAKEFFCGEWLQKRLLLYALSHMIIMIPLAYWMIFLASQALPWQRPQAIVLSFMVFLTGAIGEVARKTRSPQDEISGVDSYTSVLGVTGTAILLLILDGLFFAGLAYLLNCLARASGWLVWGGAALTGLTALMVIVKLLGFVKETGDGQGKAVEDSQGLLILVVFLILIIVGTIGGL
ncbi:hypothetical protein [Pseudobacteriovorax antillogorgiicola]|uniref:4-hydroxybenzoate polyprenyltransferase n=1 Tax=Pseudobacteriovorax antillogorgiicola TaxID=1513793 RepID=A0A1Y6CLD7_9BACT|nr:hypothetical protein [Pseudobacteriovorax antillogorgiicola]TCS45427.1 4-hydroxybenzoate polyprenyltransferase [Pseudobacteriovorax antillogorgiicola]SMF74197.1 4-hydroxybenzoate polyprenyltransferase [Pseudobacteriovorax antillogorgiicola]